MGSDPDRTAELARLPLAAPPSNHGRTTAAWVTVTLVIVGFVVSSVAFVIPLPWLVWAGMGVVVAGLVAGRVLRMLGLGQPAPGDEPTGRAHG